MNNLRVIKEIPRNRFCGVDSKCCASFEAWQVFNGVIIKKVHNDADLSAKLWTL